ncbi:MAG: response regulator transcription factor [Clostridiales bacterium]|nr:response regulator transcription factor [Clostridiales bacterium]
MTRLYIWEPNEQVARKLEDLLQKEAYELCFMKETDGFPETPETEDEPQLVLMDARMRWSVCRPLLEQCQKRGYMLLFITADKNMSEHLRALYAGRCDVVTLPLNARVLKTKLAALTATPGTGELQVDEQERVALLDGRRVELTAQETALLIALLEKPDTPVSREQLLRKAWGYQSMGETRTVDVHVQRLRKKLGGEYIETVYKCGYRLKLA